MEVLRHPGSDVADNALLGRTHVVGQRDGPVGLAIRPTARRERRAITLQRRLRTTQIESCRVDQASGVINLERIPAAAGQDERGQQKNPPHPVSIIGSANGSNGSKGAVSRPSGNGHKQTFTTDNDLTGELWKPPAPPNVCSSRTADISPADRNYDHRTMS